MTKASIVRTREEFEQIEGGPDTTLLITVSVADDSKLNVVTKEVADHIERLTGIRPVEKIDVEAGTVTLSTPTSVARAVAITNGLRQTVAVLQLDGVDFTTSKTILV